MSEADVTATNESELVMPRFPGDPAAAAAGARASAAVTTKWAWLCVLLSILSLLGFVAVISAGVFGPQDDIAVCVGILVCALVIGTCIYLFCRAYGLRKTATMADACDTMNLRFSPNVSKERLALYAMLPLFNRGHARRGYYLMEGEAAGYPVTLLEYRYTTGHGKTAHVHNQTVVIVDYIGDLPAFELSPKTFWRKLTELFGAATITFEGSPGFSAAYNLRGPDVKAIRTAFTPAVLAFFAGNRDWTLESKYGRVAVYRQDKVCRPEDCPERVATALSIIRLLRDEETETADDGNIAAND